MRSSSSRNLASQLQQQQQPQSGIGGQQRIPARACRATHNPSGEKFVAMQIMQALLFATRISFLMYDVLHAIVHKVIIYDRIGHWFGGSAAASEKLYTLSLGLIAIFLLATIIFAFIYNYMLVHENLYGIGTMAVFLVVVLVYNLIVFARYTSVLESSVICVASSGEIVGVIYLLALIKHKKQVRYVERYDKQFSGSGPDDSQDSNNKQLPHQRRLEHQMSTGGGGGGGQKQPPPPPSITISFGSESEEVLSLSRIDENSQQERDEENQGQTSPYSDFEPDRETEGANSVQDRESRQTQEEGDDEFSRYKEQSRAKHRHHHNKDKSQSQHQQQSQQPPPPSQPQPQPSQSDCVPSAKSLRSRHKPSRELERESESTNSLNDSPTANSTAKQQSKSTRRSPKQSSKHSRQQSRDHLTVPSGAAPDDLDDPDDVADSQMDNNTEQASSSLQELSAESGHRSHRSHHTSQDNQSQDNLDQQQQQHSPPSSSGHKRHSRRHHRAQQKSIDSEAPPSEVSPDSPLQPPSAMRTTVKTVLQDEYVYGEDTPTRGVHGPGYHHDDYDYQTQPQHHHHHHIHHHPYSTNSTDLVDQPYQPPPVVNQPYQPPPVVNQPYQPPPVVNQPYQPPPVVNQPYQQPPLVRTVPTNYDPLNHHYRPDQVLTQSQHPDYRFDSFYNQYQQPDQFQYGP